MLQSIQQPYIVIRSWGEKKDKTANKTEKPSPPPLAIREVYSVTAQYNSSYSSPEIAGTSRLEGVLVITIVKSNALIAGFNPMLMKPILNQLVI